MTIPPQLNNLIQRLNEELSTTERTATEALNLTRVLLTRFPNNVRLTQLFASNSNITFLVQIRRRRLQELIELLRTENFPNSLIQEAGEELSTILGQVLEAKISATQAQQILENLR